ncbi:D-alanyl-lipoteichoic acid biosynthesis protein DltD [Clostridium sp.]|uniref:D-alanyl-lipoteichoic acid biosynthesis protein DltD n=1 Tax=Clostridium sp. TaxID=1506 RepID=UPI00261EB8CB|nr:D-alanyl-lipoteichoic acid biosynthesis protein DltD [uncultured Clostridium sp.]
MKKIRALVCSISILIFICIILLFCFISHYDGINSKKYYDQYGENLSRNKFKSVELQKLGTKKGDNVFMFGSSEIIENTKYYVHPINFFKNKKAGFQMNFIGRGGYKSLVHAADFGALGKSLKGQKVVFNLSPQWFIPEGLKQFELELNSSELQVYGFLFNKDISLTTKQEFSKRIVSILQGHPNKQFNRISTYCSLYSKTDFMSTSKRYLLTPYYWIRYELLTLRDDIHTSKVLKLNSKTTSSKHTAINWSAELKKATLVAKSGSKNNKFGMDDKVYKYEIKGNLRNIKGTMKNDSYKVSPEYEDFKLLLDVCKEEGIKPLILNIPVNGQWDDYAGFNKSDRMAYYKKTDEMAKSYGFEVADFSKYENKKYFLMDTEHLGWTGWVYIDQAIANYYNENKK